jgi:hypothetical protein
MSRQSSLFTICLAAALVKAAFPASALAGMPAGMDPLEGTYLGVVDGADYVTLADVAVLAVGGGDKNVFILPYIEQENLYKQVNVGGCVEFKNDALSLLLDVESYGGRPAMMTGLMDGPKAPEGLAAAFLRPFAKAGCDLASARGAHPGLMSVGGQSPECMTFEIIDARPGLFTARMFDSSGRQFDLVGTTAADGRFLATGVGNGMTVRMTGEVTTDASGAPMGLDASFEIETRYGKPVANGIIAILIG